MLKRPKRKLQPKRSARPRKLRRKCSSSVLFLRNPVFLSHFILFSCLSEVIDDHQFIDGLRQQDDIYADDDEDDPSMRTTKRTIVSYESLKKRYAHTIFNCRSAPSHLISFSHKMGGSLEMELLSQDFELEEEEYETQDGTTKKRKRASSMQKELFIKDSTQARLQRGKYKNVCFLLWFSSC